MILPDNIAEITVTLQDGYFDLKGLAAYCTLGVSTLRDYINKGRLPAYKIKGKILVKKSEFDLWIEKHRLNRKQDPKKIANEVMKSLKSK